jgi:hypothetical protein
VSENSTRIELFAALEELAAAIPEMRVGQVLAAVGELCSDMHGRGLWMPLTPNFVKLLGLSAAITSSRLRRARVAPSMKVILSSPPEDFSDNCYGVQL